MASLAEFELRVLLSVLRCAGDAHAMAVHGVLQARARRRVSLGAVYVTLDRLERKGLLISTLGEPRAERGGRARRLYRASGTGKAAARTECLAIRDLWQGLGLVTEEP